VVAAGRPGGLGDAAAEADEEGVAQLRRCTYAGKPFASEERAAEWGKRFGRRWTPGRPRKQSVAAAKEKENDQLKLF
jgi:hypothetical protein